MRELCLGGWGDTQPGMPLGDETFGVSARWQGILNQKTPTDSASPIYPLKNTSYLQYFVNHLLLQENSAISNIPSYPRYI